MACFWEQEEITSYHKSIFFQMLSKQEKYAYRTKAIYAVCLHIAVFNSFEERKF